MKELLSNLSEDIQLRDYQIENKIKIYKNWVDFKSVMLQMPTGTGKTRLFASIVKDIHNLSKQDKKAYKVLILVHRKELIKQISENVGLRYNIAHGKIIANNEEDDFYPTQIASIQTLSRRLEKWRTKNFDFIIIDEAHHALAPTYVKVCKCFSNAKILGVTATPYRMGKQSFLLLFDKLIVSSSITEFIRKGYLSDYEYYSIKSDSKIQQLINEIKDFDIDGDYAEKTLTSIFDTSKIRANLLETYSKNAIGKKGIIYTINKQHNHHVCNTFLDAGIVTSAIDSDTDKEKREQIVKDFKNGKIQILCNVNIFSEGFDCPDVEFIQLARPTKSLSMYLQQVGRGFRVHEKKDKVIFLDNVGLYNRFGLPSANRKWEYHFKGFVLDEEEYIPKNSNDNEVIFIDEKLKIEEGNEKGELIFSSEIKITDEKFKDFKLFLFVDKGFDFNDLRNNEEMLFVYPVSFDEEIYDNLYDYLLDEEEIGFLNLFIEKIDYLKKVFKNNKVGLFNEQIGKFELEPEYEEINFFDLFGNLMIKKNEKCGIYNFLSKEIKVEIEYDDIEQVTYKPNYFITVLDGKNGLVSKVNDLKISPNYFNIIETYNFFNVETETEWLLFDSSFNQVRSNYFEVVSRFGQYDILKFEGLYAFGYNNKIVYPFINISLQIMDERIVIEHFMYGFGLLNKNLNFVIGLNNYSEIAYLGLNLFRVKKWNYQLFDIDGNIILSKGFSNIIIKENFIFGKDSEFWNQFSLNGVFINKAKKIIELLSIDQKQRVFEKPKYFNKNENYKKMFNEILKTSDDKLKSIRANKVKSEFKLTNETLSSILSLIKKKVSISPNDKLTEAEYLFIKSYIENNLD